MIYEFLTARGILSDKHKEELKEKRGFSEDIIKEHRFFSGGKYLADLEEEFLRSFSEEKLLSSGVFIKPERSGKVIFSKQILDDRIIIPYLNKEGEACFVRPHKMGIEMPIQIYHEFIENNDSHFAILTESEFKAVAGKAFGYKTIGIPGVGSFVDTHFQRLVKFIQKCGVKQICILYDNEIKDNPVFTNYKEDPFKRYDTEYFSYIIAKNLLAEGIDCRVGRLPDSWRVNGKVDLDGALAQGHSRKDIVRVIGESKDPRAFVADLSKEARNIINRKLAKKYYRTHITIDWGKYVATRRQGKQEWQEVISNFTIKILARHETMEGIVREVILIDEFGKHTKSFALTSEPMVKRDAFANFVMNKGNYVWRGTSDDLVYIWQSLFLEDDGRYIVESDHVGWIPDDKIWIFGNVVIDNEGELVHPDKHNIFWRDKYGLKPIPISVQSGKTAINEGIPVLASSKMELTDMRDRMIDTIGRFEAYTLLGWAASVLFMEEVFKAYSCFPFLFVTGRRGSGKSTIAEWTMNLFGIETGGKMASDTTPVAIQRYLSYYSSLPVFIDEYRNTKNITYKNGFLRNVYNRQSAGKGIKAAFGVREGKIRGTLLVSGEETPDENALLTRCVVVNVIQGNRKTNHFNWFQTHRMGLSWFTREILCNKKDILPHYIENLEGGKDFFVKKGLDDRMAINYAVIGSGYFAAFGELPRDFQDYLAKESTRAMIEYDSEHAMQVFWEDLQALQSNGKLKSVMWSIDDTYIYIYFQGLYSIWASEYRGVHGTEPFKAGAIRKYLEIEPGFVENGKLKKIAKYPRRCTVFLKKDAPRELLNLVEESIDP